MTNEEFVLALALKPDNIETLLLCDKSKFFDPLLQQIVECVQKHKEVCAQKIFKDCGYKGLNKYLDLTRIQDRAKTQDILDYCAKLGYTSEKIEENKRLREEEIKKILEKRGHGDLWEKKTITVKEIKERLDGA